MKKILPVLCLLVLTCCVLPAGERPSVVVAVEANWPPMEFTNEEGEIVGFSVDFVSAVAREAGFSVEYVTVPWDGIFEGLAARKYDMVASSVTITPEREKTMAFSIPYYDVRQAVVAPADSTMRVPGDLAGLAIGVQVGTTGDFATTAIEGVNVVIFEEIGHAFVALQEGKLDGVVCDDPVATSYILEDHDQGKRVKVALTLPSDEPEFYGLAVNKDNQELLDLLNFGITKVQEKGIDGDLHRKWVGF